MFRESQTEVVVVGAGPVGMLTALALAKQGVQVDLVDSQEETAAHSHSCALHPRTLSLLAQMGLADKVLAHGRRVDGVAFYEGDSRCAELKFSELPGDFPFLLVLPQNDLEDLLEQTLAQQPGTRVHWSHRLADLQPQGDKVLATVDKLCETSKGYPIATWQHVVQKTIRTQAAFVVGADGRGSQVRRLLKIEHETAGRPECFALFEFESDAKFSNEVRVVLHKDTSNVLWPLPGNRWRWTFQIAPEEVPDEAHLKERPHFRLVDPPADQEVLRQMHRLVEQRAPWFDAAADELDWFTVIDFEPRVARQYGQDRCWLAGDSAHTTSPIGMQSMNVGLREAVELAHLLTGILRGERSLDSLASYTFRYQNEWRQLLGMGSCITPTQGALPWAQMHSARILPCVPASGDDLVQLLSQIGLTFHKIPANKTTTKEICPDTSLS